MQLRNCLPSAGPSSGALGGGCLLIPAPARSGQVTSLLKTHRAAQDPAARSRVRPRENRRVLAGSEQRGVKATPVWPLASDPNRTCLHGAVGSAMRRVWHWLLLQHRRALRKQPVPRSPVSRASVCAKCREYRAGLPVETRSGCVATWGLGWEGLVHVGMLLLRATKGSKLDYEKGCTPVNIRKTTVALNG